MDWTVEWNVEWLKQNAVVRIAHPLLKQVNGHGLGPKWHSIRSHRRLSFNGCCIKAFTLLTQKSDRSDTEF